MSDTRLVQHDITIRVKTLLSFAGGGAAVDVRVFAVGPDGNRLQVHTESFVGKVARAHYVRKVAVWVNTSFGLVSRFELECVAEPGVDAEVAMA
ncbi:hypothetical protein [Achromobacter marplatensis]|uniref:hypothetical protein n=1 Tax=Achromobacter marplatensis TaxID=470868 RepID=UPI000277E449|nr:hypothetical protein [Achromobacter marplatensis]EJO29601.1 hypothetical protein QWC_20927 [Achromobacter marplatensis]